MNSTFKFWLQFLPVSLRLRIEGSPDLQKIIANTGWLFADNALRMVIGLLVGVWVARYLGPEQFGLLNYAIAFVALFGTIASLGLDGIVVRDLVSDPKSASVTLGTAFVLQSIGGLLAFCLVVIAIGFIRPDDTLVKVMVTVFGFAMTFKAATVVKYWFESQVRSKYTVWVENFVFLISACVKVLLIVGHASLMAFVWVALAEALLVAVALLIMYASRGGHFRDWRIQPQRAKTLFRDSWPLILSGLAVLVYMRIDQIMLGQIRGDDAVGIYSAAARLSEALYFIPVAIVSSVFPSIIEAKKRSETLYYKRLQKLYDLLLRSALLVAVLVSLSSPYIIDFLFGINYSGASIVLSIYVWGALFVYFGTAWSRWMVNEGYQATAFKLHLLTLTSNIGLNFLLIPRYGAAGAATATAISYSLGHTVFALFFKNQKIAVSMFWLSLNPFRQDTK